jgi:hypothetical protein
MWDSLIKIGILVVIICICHFFVLAVIRSSIVL